MKRLIDLSNEEAKIHFLKGSSYFNGNLPKYIGFEPILNDVSDVLKGGNYAPFMKKNANPTELPGTEKSIRCHEDCCCGCKRRIGSDST